MAGLACWPARTGRREMISRKKSQRSHKVFGCGTSVAVVMRRMIRAAVGHGSTRMFADEIGIAQQGAVSSVEARTADSAPHDLVSANPRQSVATLCWPLLPSENSTPKMSLHGEKDSPRGSGSHLVCCPRSLAQYYSKRKTAATPNCLSLPASRDSGCFVAQFLDSVNSVPLW